MLWWPSFREASPQWQIVDYQSYANEGFGQNSIVYSAIMYKVRSLLGVPLRAYTGDRANPEPAPSSSPLVQLTDRPNPHQSFTQLHAQNVVALNLSGDAYTYVERPKRDSWKGAALYSLRPDRVFIVPANDPKVGGGLLGYVYVPEGRSAWERWSEIDRRQAIGAGKVALILPENMLHVKLPNPLDPLEGLGYGMPPLSPGARSADVDNMVTKFLGLFFERGGVPPYFVSYDVPLSAPMLAQARELLTDTMGGYENWTRPGILGKGGKVERIGMNFQEMGFGEIDERNESRILGPFGVPPILIGTRTGLQRSTYSNYAQARTACWEDTLLPENGLHEAEYQYHLRDGETFVAFDYSGVPALRKDIAALTTAAYQLWQMGTPANAAFQTVGLEIQGELPMGDTGYLPFSVMPVGGQAELPATEAGAARAATETRAALPLPERKAALSPDQKAVLWTKADRTATAWEPRFAEAASTCLEHDRRELLAALGALRASTLRHKQTVAWSEYLLSATDYLRVAGEKQWREAFIPIIEGIIVDQGEELNATFGMQFNIRNLFGEKWFESYTLKFSQPILQTTLDDVHKLVGQALAKGWSIPQMQKQLELTFDRYLEPGFTVDGRGLTDEETQWFNDRRPAYRTENIARTESLRAENAGSEALYRDWGVQSKEWYSTNDERTRFDHRVGSAWGKEPLVTDINGVFEIGGERLAYPGDPNGSPSQVCQCRCVVLAVLPTGLGGD